MKNHRLLKKRPVAFLIPQIIKIHLTDKAVEYDVLKKKKKKLYNKNKVIKSYIKYIKLYRVI